MSILTWKMLPDEVCPNCGQCVEAHTEAKDGCIYDGEDVRCSDLCGEEGVFMGDQDDSYIFWNDITGIDHEHN